MCVNRFYPQANAVPERAFRLILYPMRVRDFRRFGFTDVLNLPGVVED